MAVLGISFQAVYKNSMVEEALDKYASASADVVYEDPEQQSLMGFIASGG